MLKPQRHGRRISAGNAGGPGWGKAKQRHHGLPPGRSLATSTCGTRRKNLTGQVRAAPFKPIIKTQIPGHRNSPRVIPKLAKVNDKFTMIRSMSYTPNGLFNHTAAIYQIMTGYTTDKVSAESGQLEPPNAKDYPNFGSNIIRLKPLNRADAPVRRCSRVRCRNRTSSARAAAPASSAKAYDPYTLFPDGDDLDMSENGQASRSRI